MTRPTFPAVRDHRPDAPRPPASLSRAAWSFLFVVDFLLGLTDRPNSEGDVVRKTELPGRTADLYRRLYPRLFREVERHLPEDQVEPLPVPSVDASQFGRREFAHWRRHARSPLVLKGLLADSRAVREWSKEWLAEKYGDSPVRCMDLSELSLGILGQNVRLHDLSLADFLLRDEYENFYINNFHGVFDDEDFRLFCEGDRVDGLRGSKRDLTQWFISRSSRTGTPLHCANADNLFLNLKGIKEWHFIDPAYTPALLPALSRYAVYAVSELGEVSDRTLEERYAAYPHLKRIPKLVCRLEEGDVLYNPPWWWHNVRNLTDFNVGCATRYIAHPVNLRSSPQFHICQFLDAVKHPSRSFMTRGAMGTFFGRDRRHFLDSIFSKGPAEQPGKESGDADR